jgi:hypothetical protein
MHFLDVPYYSQYQNVLEEKWRSRACGVTSVKMVLKYFYPDNDESIDALIDEGVRIGGYKTEHGWDHETLVRLLRNRGLFAYREEFKSQVLRAGETKGMPSIYDAKMAKAGIKKIFKMLKAGRPVIVSVDSGFGENTTSHLIVLVGFDLDDSGEVAGFVFNDPDAKTGIKKNIFVEIGKFEKYWRRMSIFVG